MKIFPVEQIRAADKYTIEHEPVSSLALMERAAQACVTWLLTRYGKKTFYFIVCGNGNNGGDGLAIARLLAKEKCAVKVYVVRAAKKDADDFENNLTAILAQGRESVIDAAETLPDFATDRPAVVVDAVFGSGLSRKPSGIAAKVIDRINLSGLPVVAVDLPSGLFADDNATNTFEHVVKASDTLTFEFPKLAFFFAEHNIFTGNFHILPIGIDPGFVRKTPSPFSYPRLEDVRLLVKKRAVFAHKGNFGHALLIAGSHGKIGAAVLAARGCLRAGTGLLTVCVPPCGYEIMQGCVPEAMVALTTVGRQRFISGKLDYMHFSAIGIGPGIGTHTETKKFLFTLLRNFRNPVVLDADAINILGTTRNQLENILPENSVLTPHPGEFDRLTKKHASAYERLLTQRAFSKKYKVYVVLKGAYTSISSPDGSVVFNSTGNPGMAKGGSGDVLTGVITGLLAQGYATQDACVLGVFLHGTAGDIAAAAQSVNGMTSGDVADHLGAAWRMLEG